MEPARRPSLSGVLLFLPLAAVGAWTAYLGVAAVVGGLGAGADDVAFAADSGAPGWFFALVGLLVLAAAGLLVVVGWRVSSGSAPRWLLVLVAALCLPALILWGVGLIAGGPGGLASVLTIAPYLLLLALWRLRTQRGPGAGLPK